MHTNSLVPENISPNQDLLLVRYSQSPHPDYINVKFKGYDIKHRQIEYSYNDRIKKINVSKAIFRLFIDQDEMAKSLYDCFLKRDVELVDEYKDLMRNSQDNRPEIWI